MTIDEIRKFIVIYESGSITKATERLYISQPNLSKILKKIEIEVGSKLINRKDCSLTSEGMIFYKSACEIISIVSEMEMNLKVIKNELSSKESQKIKIVHLGTGAAYKICDLFQKKYKQYSVVQIKRETEKECVDLLEEGLVDIAIIENYSNENFDKVLITTNTIFLKIPDHHILLNKKYIEFSDLINETIYLSTKDVIPNDLLNELRNIDGINLLPIDNERRYFFIYNNIDKPIVTTMLEEAYLNADIFSNNRRFNFDNDTNKIYALRKNINFETDLFMQFVKNEYLLKFMMSEDYRIQKKMGTHSY